MSWAEVKKINSDLATPLDVKIDALAEKLTNTGGQQGDISTLIKSLAKELENVIVDRTTGNYCMGECVITLTNSSPFELYAAGGEMFIRTKYIDAITVVCDVSLNKQHWIRDADSSYYVTVPFTDCIFVECSTTSTISFSYIARVRAGASVTA